MGRSQDASHLRATRRRELARLRAQGYSLDEIARQLGVHRNTITNDVRAIEQEYLDQTRRTMEAIVQREVQRLEQARSQAWRDFYEHANRHGETQQATYLDLVLEASRQLASLLRLSDPGSHDSEIGIQQRPKVIEVTIRTREQADSITRHATDLR